MFSSHLFHKMCPLAESSSELMETSSLWSCVFRILCLFTYTKVWQDIQFLGHTSFFDFVILSLMSSRNEYYREIWSQPVFLIISDLFSLTFKECLFLKSSNFMRTYIGVDHVGLFCKNYICLFILFSDSSLFLFLIFSLELYFKYFFLSHYFFSSLVLRPMDLCLFINSGKFTAIISLYIASPPFLLLFLCGTLNVRSCHSIFHIF